MSRHSLTGFAPLARQSAHFRRSGPDISPGLLRQPSCVIDRQRFHPRLFPPSFPMTRRRASLPRRQRGLPQILRVARVRDSNRTRVSMIPLTCRGKRRTGYERATSKAPFRSPGTLCGREVGVRPTSCLARCFSPRGVSHLLNRNSPRWRGAVPAMQTRLATSRMFAGSWQRANTRELDPSGGGVATARYLAARIPMG